MNFLGIDPGASGALALVSESGALLAVADMPVVDKMVSAPLLSKLIQDWESEHGNSALDVAIIERVHSMPRQGVASSFKFGHAYGVVLGVVGALEWQSQLVTPQAWKKAMAATADKEQVRRLAIERWPKSSDLFKRKMDADRAEAALLAAYGLRLTIEVAA